MATLGATAFVTGSAAPAFFASGPLGWAVGVGLIATAALVDQKIIAGLQGKPREQDRAPTLLGLPAQSTEAGAPRIWALGRRVRVPCHVLWQSEKEISVSIMGGAKGAPGVNQNQVLVDCALAVNDRETNRILQMVTQGQLLFWLTRNIITVETSGMVVSESGGNLVLTMADNFEQDWTDKFAVDDNVVLSGFTRAAGTPNINVGHWRVVTVTAHGVTPSTLTLSPYLGQSLVGLSATAGTPASPAMVSRLDDVAARHDATGYVRNGSFGFNEIRITFPSETHIPINDLFSIGDRVALEACLPSYVNGVQLRVTTVSEFVLLLVPVTSPGNSGTGTVAVTFGSSTNAGYVRFWSPTTSTKGILPATFNPSTYFHRGTDTQTAGSIIEAVEGVGDVPGYRGVAYQELDDFNVTRFGGGVGPQTEALIEPDSGMTWPLALQLVCERGGVPAEFVDTTDVPDDNFEGMYLRGNVPAAQNLQGMLLVKQVATQDRDGVLCFSAIDNLDVVQVVNGEDVSDLGANIDGAEVDDAKLAFSDAAPEDSPTSIGIRHQDPDNFYAAGYQTFGVRNPGAVTEENRQEIDLSNVVMTRRQANGLATTIMRRSHINARTVRMQLPANYMHVLENDLLTVTTDEGDDITVRVTRRDVGSNFLVQITGVQEELDLAVSGSPAQSGAGLTNRIPQRLPPIIGRVLDIPPLRDVDSYEPGFLLVAGPEGGGAWAGCTVYRTIDGGANWVQVAAIANKGGIGTTTDALDAAVPSETHGSSSITWDAVSSFTVEFSSLSALPLVTVTEDEVLDGANWFLLRDANGEIEVVGARDVVQNTATNYTFSYLLRGLRGTIDGAAVDKADGAEVTHITDAADTCAVWVSAAGLETSRVQEFRFVPPGEDVSDATSVPANATWRNCTPFPVRDVTKTINGTTSVRFEVDHWTRRAVQVGSTGPYPLDEPYEEYRIDLWSEAGTAIVYRRTITSRGTGSPTLRDKWVDFSAAECTAAGYTLGPGETFWVDVVQTGDYGESRSNLRSI